jgi:hypothetical protein
MQFQITNLETYRRAAKRLCPADQPADLGGKIRTGLLTKRRAEYETYLTTAWHDLMTDGVKDQLEFCWRLTDRFKALAGGEECLPVVSGPEGLDALPTPFLAEAISQEDVILGFCTIEEEPTVHIGRVFPLPCWHELTDLVERTMRSARCPVLT